MPIAARAKPKIGDSRVLKLEILLATKKSEPNSTLSKARLLRTLVWATSKLPAIVPTAAYTFISAATIDTINLTDYLWPARAFAKRYNQM